LASLALFTLLAANATDAANATIAVAESANATVRAAGGMLNEAANATGMKFSSGGFMWSSYLQAVGGVFFLLAVLAAGFYLLKRFGPRAGLGLFPRAQFKVEAQLPLGPRKSVVVVRFLNKRLVLGVTDANINLLIEMETGHDNESGDFTSLLEEAQTRHSAG